MAVEGAKKFDAQFLEDSSAFAVHHKLLETGFSPSSRLARHVPHHRQTLDRSLCHSAQPPITGPGLHFAHCTEILMQSAHIIGDRFVVVVKHNDEILLQATS